MPLDPAVEPNAAASQEEDFEIVPTWEEQQEAQQAENKVDEMKAADAVATIAAAVDGEVRADLEQAETELGEVLAHLGRIQKMADQQTAELEKLKQEAKEKEKSHVAIVEELNRQAQQQVTAANQLVENTKADLIAAREEAKKAQDAVKETREEIRVANQKLEQQAKINMQAAEEMEDLRVVLTRANEAIESAPIDAGKVVNDRARLAAELKKTRAQADKERAEKERLQKELQQLQDVKSYEASFPGLPKASASAAMSAMAREREALHGGQPQVKAWSVVAGVGYRKK